MLVHPKVAPISCFLFFGCLFFKLLVYSLISYILEHMYALHFLSQVQMVIMFSWWLCSDGDYAQTVTIDSNGYVLDFCQWLMQMVFCWWSYGSQIYFLSSWFVYLEVHSSLRSWYSQHVQKVLTIFGVPEALISYYWDLHGTWFLYVQKLCQTFDLIIFIWFKSSATIISRNDGTLIPFDPMPLHT